MSIRRLNGVSRFDSTGGVRLAVDLINKSGLVEQLQPLLDARQGKGRPSQYPRFTVLAVLATWFLLIYQGHPATAANIMRYLWFEFTEDELVTLGLPKNWRNPNRLASMRAIPAVLDQEYKRLHRFIVDMLDPIDDTPFPAGKNITVAEVERALTENTARLQPKTDLRNKAMNDIVGASVPKDLLARFRAHLSTDLHKVVICPDPRSDPTAKGRKKLGPPIATYTPTAKRFEGAVVIGLTLAIAVGEPGQPHVPNGIALGMALGPAMAADIPAALIAIDAADRHAATKPTSSNAIRLVVGDKAYPYGRGFVAALNDRGRSMLGDYRIDQPHIFDLWAKPDDTDCPRLANGCIVCPGIPRATLEAADPLLREKYDDMTDAELREVERLYETIEAGRMPTNGRPRRSRKRKPGRPAKNDTTPDETVFKVEVFCPARRGKIRCPRVPESMTSNVKHLATPPEGTMSWVCTGATSNAKTQLTISENAFKTYSPIMAGTLDHHRFYKYARAHNEGYHSFLTHPEGANLRDRTIQWRRTSSISLSIAFAVATVNIRSADVYREILRRDGKYLGDGGIKPPGDCDEGDGFAA